jgi:hypothetical protein
MNTPASVKLIVTGATGMVGEGVLHTCLQDARVEKVLVVGRKSCGVTHAKLQEIIVPDFYNLSALEGQLKEYDGCLFCLGVSSVGLKEDAYSKLTHTLTTGFANVFVKQNPGATFCYISGAGTDSSEKGKIMWARVKGKTENDLAAIFQRTFNFRPGIIEPMANMKNTLSFYKYLGWLIPVIRLFAPKSVIPLNQLGTAMINAVILGGDKKVLEVRDIFALADKK